MTAEERRREDDFEARWSEAGATPEEREALAGALSRLAEPVRRGAGTWRAAEARARANRRAHALRLTGGLGFVTATLAGVVLFLGRAEEAPPRLEAAVAERTLTAETPEAPAKPDAPRAIRGGHIRPAAHAKLRELEPEHFVLDEGEARVEVAATPSAAVVHLRAGDLDLEALGAVFSVKVEGGHGSVHVFEGTLSVRHGGVVERLGPGATSGVRAEGQRDEPQDVRKEVREEVRKAESKLAARVARALRRVPAPEERRVAARTVLAPPEEARALEPGAEGTAMPKVAAEEAAPGSAPKGEVVMREELAAYARALRSLRDGRPAEAASAFADYLARYPRGALVEEAELSRLEALAAAGDAALRSAAARWLEGHPDHPRAAEVRALTRDR